MAEINTPCKRYEAARDGWQLVDDLESRATMRQAGRRRLPILPAETEPHWIIRRDWARLVPALNTAIETLAGRLREANIRPDENAPPRLVDWYWANELHKLLDNTALDGLRYGQSHWWIDSDGVYQIPAKDMLEYFPLTGQPIYCRFRRNIEMQGDAVKYRIYEATPESVKIYQSDSDSDYQLTDELQNGLQFVPVITFQYSDTAYKPYFLTLAEMNEEYWQLSAFHNNALSFASFNILVGRGIGDDIKISNISPRVLLMIPVDAEIVQLEGGGAGIEAGRQALIDLELRMAALSARPLQTDNVKSATEINRSSATEDAPIKRLAEMQIAGVNQALRIAGEILGVPGEWFAEGKTDFTPTETGSNDIAQVLSAAAMGIIDNETARIALTRGIAALRDVSPADISARVDGGAVTVQE